MVRIDGNTIRINRGNKLLFKFSIPFYDFKKGDVLTFGIYNKNGMSKEALLLKDFNITEETTQEVIMEFSKEEMKIGDLINKPTEYWYEIELNHEETVLGYDDEEGPKILELYPEGSEIPKKVE